MKVIINLGILLLAPFWLGAQSVADAYVLEAMTNNKALLQKQNLVAQKRSEVSQAQGLFAPQLSFQANYTLAYGGRELNFPVGDMLNPAYAALNELTESNQFPTDIENVEEQFLPHNFQETKLRLIQPIFNSDLYYNLKARQNLLSLEQARVEAYELELAYTVKTAYYQYLQSEEGIKVYESNMASLKALLETNRKLVKEGQQSPEAVYRTQVAINHLKADWQAAVESRDRARNYFNFLLNRPLSKAITIDSNVNSGTLAPDTNISQRPELKALEAARLAQANEVNRLSAQRLPNLNLVVDAGFQGFGYEFDEQEFLLMQVGLQWNIFSGFSRRSQQATANLQLENLQLQEAELLQQLRLQVAQAWVQLESAQAQMSAQQAATENARKNLEIAQKKYAQGQILLLELLDAQNSYQAEQQALLISTYRIPMAVAAIERATAL